MITIKTDRTKIDALIKRIQSVSPKDRAQVIKKSLVAAALEVESHMQEKVLSGQVLKVRTGALRRSITSAVTDIDGDMIALIGSGVRQSRKATYDASQNRWNPDGRLPYADIQETGGVIKPRKAKYLAIPLPAALTAAGVLKKRPRDYRDTFVRTSKSGNLIIFQKVGARGKITALFVLKKSVTVPASRYMSITAEAMQDKVIDIMSRSVRRQLEGASL